MMRLMLLLLLLLLGLANCAAVRELHAAAPQETLAFPIVGTGQAFCSDASRKVACPRAAAGQDAATKASAVPRYTVSRDGLTVKDEVTGLMWPRSADLNGDGKIDALDKRAFPEAKKVPAALNAKQFGGFSDWRMPSIKELYSLIDFSGTDPVPTSKSSSGLRPFLPSAFRFAWGDIARGERIIDVQAASATQYVALPSKVFGVNFADGRIKGYDSAGGVLGNRTLQFFVLPVRGNPSYGVNKFKDNADGTVTDEATGLMWSKSDSGKGMDWQAALDYAARKNEERFLGHSDWRVPNIKELQALVDYMRSPDTTGSPALDPVFQSTPITNERGDKDWPFMWSSTTHVSHSNETDHFTHAAYVSFGRCLGLIDASATGQTGLRRLRASRAAPGSHSAGKAASEAAGYAGMGWNDIHGAGCQRSDPKLGKPGHVGPQGDVRRVANFVRLVRTAARR